MNRLDVAAAAETEPETEVEPELASSCSRDDGTWYSMDLAKWSFHCRQDRDRHRDREVRAARCVVGATVFGSKVDISAAWPSYYYFSNAAASASTTEGGCPRYSYGGSSSSLVGWVGMGRTLALGLAVQNTIQYSSSTVMHSKYSSLFYL